jgi:hypothetical protein
VSITVHRETALKQAENSILLNNHEINFVLQLQHHTACVSIKISGIMDKKNAFYTSLTWVQPSGTKQPPSPTAIDNKHINVHINKQRT